MTALDLPPPLSWPTIAQIQARVAVARQVPMLEMISERRQRNVAHARQLAMYLAKQLTPRSLPQIGRHFGGRDHTTVIHAVRQVEKRLAADPVLREQTDLLAAALRASVEAGGLLAAEAVEGAVDVLVDPLGEIGSQSGSGLAGAADGRGGDGGVDGALADLVAVEILPQLEGEEGGRCGALDAGDLVGHGSFLSLAEGA